MCRLGSSKSQGSVWVGLPSTTIPIVGFEIVLDFLLLLKICKLQKKLSPDLDLVSYANR